MILADTSAWVEFDRGTGSEVNRAIRALIEADDGMLAVTDPVVMEVVAGARDDRRERDLRRLLARFTFLPFRPAPHFDGAVRIYRACRASGVTPRGLVDCMIAAVAQSEGAALLAADRDLARIAEVIDLDLDPATLR